MSMTFVSKYYSTKPGAYGETLLMRHPQTLWTWFRPVAFDKECSRHMRDSGLPMKFANPDMLVASMGCNVDF